MKILSPVDQYYDDSLTLAQVPQNYLRRIILPMGDFTKEVTRRIASGAGLGHLQSVRVCLFAKKLITVTFCN